MVVCQQDARGLIIMDVMGDVGHIWTSQYGRHKDEKEEHTLDIYTK
jgi:hypothetical protein